MTVRNQFKTKDSYCTIKKRVGALTLTLFLIAMPFMGFAQSEQSESKVQKPATEVSEHSPTRALILSALLPGAGQVYNRQAWKIPIIYAALGGISYYTYTNFSQMKYYRDEYLFRVAHDGQTQYPDNPDMAATPTSNIYNMYEAYNQTFQLSVILTVAVYGINLLDAYVFGHLFDFQINDDISLNMSPSFMPNSGTYVFGQSPLLPAASLTLRF